MSEDEEYERTTWIPIAIAAGLVAAILAAILLVDGSSDEEPKQPAPSSPVSSGTP